jgi:hypothetical protein
MKRKYEKFVLFFLRTTKSKDIGNIMYLYTIEKKRKHVTYLSDVT